MVSTMGINDRTVEWAMDMVEHGNPDDQGHWYFVAVDVLLWRVRQEYDRL